MIRFVVGTSVIALLMLGGCGGGGGSSSDVSVAGNASGLQTPQEAETTPTETADQTPVAPPANLPALADASDSGPDHARTPNIRSIVPVTNSATVPEDDAGALSETPTLPTPLPKPQTSPVVTTEVEDDEVVDTDGTTTPKAPRPPKAPKAPKPITTSSNPGSNGGSSTPDHGPGYTTTSGDGSPGPAALPDVAAVATPEPLTTSLVVMSVGSLAAYATRRRR